MAAGRRSMPGNTQMQLRHLSVLALLTGLLSPGTAGFAQGKSSLYESVQAILSENCLSCHGAAQMSGLDLSQRDTLLKGGSRGPALVPGKAEDSLLFQAVAHSGELRMPPESARLSREKLDLIRRWIDAGALWKESGRPRRGGARLVVVPEAAAAALAAGGRTAVERQSDRCLRAGQAPGERVDPGASRRQAHPDPAGLFRPDRPPPHAGAGGAVPRGRARPGPFSRW